MIYVKEHIHKNGFTIESSGHAVHDICVHITANINTLHQYIVDQQEFGNVKIHNRKYQYGETCISFEIINEEKAQFIIEVINAVMRGIELIQGNFPQEVNFWWGYD